MSRKQSQLNQADLGFIFGLSDYSNISRWEQGHRLPNLEVLIGYHLLFGIAIESLFEREKQAIAKVLAERIRLLLENLKLLKASQKVKGRMDFLESALVRLTV
jgi:transcriptional regulator with XRE-family HTH domain